MFLYLFIIKFYDPNDITVLIFCIDYVIKLEDSLKIISTSLFDPYPCLICITPDNKIKGIKPKLIKANLHSKTNPKINEVANKTIFWIENPIRVVVKLFNFLQSEDSLTPNEPGWLWV